jgi:hypothetical protein
VKPFFFSFRNLLLREPTKVRGKELVGNGAAREIQILCMPTRRLEPGNATIPLSAGLGGSKPRAGGDMPHCPLPTAARERPIRVKLLYTVELLRKNSLEMPGHMDGEAENLTAAEGNRTQWIPVPANSLRNRYGSMRSRV